MRDDVFGSRIKRRSILPPFFFFFLTTSEYIALSKSIWMYTKELGMGIEPITVGDIANYALFYVATFSFFRKFSNLSFEESLF
jgi:hypothetical protein